MDQHRLLESILNNRPDSGGPAHIGEAWAEDPKLRIFKWRRERKAAR